ncbi:MAG: 3-hydroxyacyl-ACP dehydratase FabZ family protein [Candidatus Methylomirabilia bacterium]
MPASDLTEAIRAAAVADIERQGDGSVRQRYVFPADFPGFAGHFPGRPILPAVLQIMAATLLVEAATGQRLLATAIERAKFVLPIVPGALVEIACRRLPGALADLWEIRIDAGRQMAASFSLTLRAPAAGA